MITLRELKEKDAPFMLEWMHDSDIQNGFRKNMLGLTIEDALDFCENASFMGDISSKKDLHFAIADDSDEYLGTVSLKNIDRYNGNAEYAIVLRKKAQGKDLGKEATLLVLEKAFSELGLHKVYLNVLANNTNAINMYERCGFVFEGEFREHLLIDGSYVNLKWYSIVNS